MGKRRKYLLLASSGGLLASGLAAQFVPRSAASDLPALSGLAQHLPALAGITQGQEPDVGNVMEQRSPGQRVEGKLMKTKGKTLIPPPKVLAESTPAVAPPVAAVAPAATPLAALIPAAAASPFNPAFLIPLIPAGCAVLCDGGGGGNTPTASPPPPSPPPPSPPPPSPPPPPPSPPPPPPPPIPEPGTWMMMTVGFGLVGTALRRRRRKNGATDDAKIAQSADSGFKIEPL